MGKTVYTTISLIFIFSISSFANNKTSNDKSIESTKNITSETSVIKINDVKCDKNTVSLLIKYNFKKHSSRKSRMNNLNNYLKNPEKLDRTTIALC